MTTHIDQYNEPVIPGRASARIRNPEADIEVISGIRTTGSRPGMTEKFGDQPY
jgi:hypothetical protein